MRVRKTLGLTAGVAAPHVNDLSVAHGQHLIPLDSTAAASDEPLRRADDLVADLRELGLHLDPLLASLLDLELENLTGLIGAVSGRCAFPPQMTVRDTAPLRILCEQRGKRLRVTAIECFGCRTKLVDHRLILRVGAGLRGDLSAPPGCARRGRRAHAVTRVRMIPASGANIGALN